MHCHYDQFVINSVSNHPHGKRIFTSAPMVTCFVRKPSRSHILEKIGILKRGSERCKPDRPLTVTQQLLQHHVTVEFQGSMGKFVQLSTQIRAHRNSRGRGEKGVFLCVACTCVYTEILRTENTKKELFQTAPGEYLWLKQKLLPAYCAGLSWLPLLNRPCLDLSPFTLC